jgi:formylglycine-generating enzyme required for sulfatase activity
VSDSPPKSRRVYRGGRWFSGPQDARVANRNRNAPGSRYDSLGIRLVEEVTGV